MANMRPRVTKRERKLHLSYELPHRIHDAQIYPITAPNGSTLIIYGHSQGLRLLWRGGRRRRDGSTTARTNGARQDQLMVLDDDDTPDAEFEDEEEELDQDCPYASITQELDLSMEWDVLRVAVPSLNSSALTPPLLRKNALVTIALSNGTVMLLQIPLNPPAERAKDQARMQIYDTRNELAGKGPVPSNVAVKFFPVDSHASTGLKRQQEGVEGHLLIASAFRALNIWTMSVMAHELAGEEQSMFQRFQTVPLSSPSTCLSFHPSVRSAQVLLVDISGAARIYDPHALKTAPKRPGSSDSQLEAPKATGAPGKWITTYLTGFHSEQDVAPGLARRKKILDAKWVNSGKGVLALMDDGQWGVWDVLGTLRSENHIQGFVLEGYLSSSPVGDAVESNKPKKGLSNLAPMTPNTRKAKSQELFTGAPKVAGVASRGGISVSSTTPRTGQTDESVVMWYNTDVYSIASMQQFWQRSTSSGGSVGSMHAPAMAHLTDIDLISENITSVSQFRSQFSSAGIGHMNTRRDLLISGEHRALILQNLRPPTPARGLFSLVERPASRDVAMSDSSLGQGLDGINAVLDSMNTTSRRVGFAQ
ncbi:hypothetical protein DOTSEDRAFT_91513 [Lecanosticta acicola]|uniref:Nucleoporin NUP37 n=1 Tax=Lecanosticta acicola TaxID=111012 RepID=A0AAI9EFE4_9PEZI|nr:hypothetical protein DOTSEDRAFT_91513 [Lecanosticta acicola]